MNRLDFSNNPITQEPQFPFPCSSALDFALELQIDRNSYRRYLDVETFTTALVVYLRF